MSALESCRDIANRHNLRRLTRSWRGDCPACSYPDAFSVREGKAGGPLLFCASCRDVDALVEAVGLPPREPDPADQANREAEQAHKRDRALQLWRGADPAAGTPAAIYLAGRGLGHVAVCPDLRFRSDCPHPESGRRSAMLAMVRDGAGEPLAVHRTYLRRDGNGKADVMPAKASLGPVWGGAIRLAPIAAEMAIGEGIETAAAAGLLTGLPAWAAISAGNLAKGLVLPADVRAVVIAVDRDAAGERAAAAAAIRWRGEGRRVRLLVPDRPGQDAADVLRERAATDA